MEDMKAFFLVAMIGMMGTVSALLKCWGPNPTTGKLCTVKDIEAPKVDTSTCMKQYCETRGAMCINQTMGTTTSRKPVTVLRGCVQGDIQTGCETVTVGGKKIGTRCFCNIDLCNGGSLQCWGTDSTAGKTCSAIGAQKVDTSTCKKFYCESGQMCSRTSEKTAGGTDTTLWGCALGAKAGCQTRTVHGHSATECYCDTDLCNGAKSTFASLSSIGIGLFTFFASFYARS